MLGSASLKYRPDIDGLRAFAVLIVVLYHAFPGRITGGFVGVDIFFVISGFLITSIIVNDISSSHFSLKQFYIRRVCRIFPPLLLVLCSVLVAGWLFFLPHEFQRVGQHVAAGVAFIANIILSQEDTYFHGANILKPLMHLWSLGIEEQFYLIWPVVLVTTWSRPKLFFILFTSTLLISLGLNEYRLPYYPNKAFFILHHRVWELLIGASLAFISGNSILKKTPNILSCFGFILCFFAASFLTSHHPYPGSLALFPTIGAALIIISPSSWINRKILSNRFLVYVGLISYSLYLWHWPILSFFHIVENELSNLLKWILLLTSLILSVLSYELVEKPIRSFSLAAKKKLTFFLLSASGVVVVAGLLIYNQDIPTYTQNQKISKIVSVKNDWGFPGDSRSVRLSREISYFVNGTGGNSLLFLGDSQVMQYYPRIRHIMKMNHKLIFFPHGACPQVPYLYDLYQRSDICPKTLEATLQLVRNEKPKVIVISSFFSNHFSSYSSYIIKNQKAGYGSSGFDLSMHYMKEHLLQLRKLGAKVYIVFNVPAGRQFDPSRMFQRSFSLNPVVLNIQNYKRSSDLQELRHIKARIRQAAEAAGAKVIDPSDYLCSVEECEVLDENGFPKYMDEIHLRAGYVKDSIKYLDEVLD